MPSRPTRYSTKKRVLVTGGAGFIGSHLCARLLEQGDQVLCVDNFFTGTRGNVAGLLGNPDFELLRHDVTMPLFVEVDEIYNLACPASPVHYQFDPVQTTKTSVIGAVNMLGLAKRLRVPILQASTSEVYGDPAVHPQTEDYWGNVNPIGPRSCYDEGKRCAETLFFDYRRQHNLAIKVARIFNTYGPHMHPNDGRVVSNFIVQALRGEDITIYGDGQQTRSFCYVDDLVRGLMALMATPHDETGPINLGNPGEFTMLELAQTVIEMTGSQSQLMHMPLPQDDPRQRQPNIARAQSVLGWEVSVPLRDGLGMTIDYFRGLQDEFAESDRLRTLRGQLPGKSSPPRKLEPRLLKRAIGSVMVDNISNATDPAGRFYQRNFERLSSLGAADNFADGAAIRAGTHRYSSAHAHLAATQGQVVLEMGYGGNGIIDLLAPLADEYHIVDIVDRSGSKEPLPNVRVYQANLDNRFPFADAQFDTVIAMMVIEHMYDPFHAFGEAARVTKAGGDLFVNLPNIASIKCRLQLLAGRMPVTSSSTWFADREWDGNHLHLFTVADVARLAALYGLDLLEVRPVGRFLALKALRPSLLCHEITYRFRKSAGA